MPTTTTPLPYDLPTLRQYWFPPEPTDTTVTAARAAQAAIWTAVTDATDELNREVADERAAVIALVDRAIDGTDITKTANDLGRDSPVPSVRHHVDLLNQASSLVTYWLTTAERTDPAHLAWLDECREIESDWQRTMSSDDRTASLLAFAERHR